jgi:hypothetical protein
MEGASKKWIAQFSISESDVCPPDPPVFAIPSHESPESAIKAAVIKAKEAIDSEKSKNDIVLSESQTPNFQRTRTREKFPEAAGRRAGCHPQSPSTSSRFPPRTPLNMTRG